MEAFEKLFVLDRLDVLKSVVLLCGHRMDPGGSEMGLLQRFRAYQQRNYQRRIAKATKTVQNSKAIREERWAALEYLCGVDTPEDAVPALLERFEYSLEHGINDTREKELAMEGILKFNEKALPFVAEKLSKSTRIAWPIKMLKVLGSRESVRDALQEALNFDDVAFDQAAVDKNFDILCYLRDYKLGNFTSRLQRFLEDPDERVRFAASEALIEQEEAIVKPMLEPFLLDSSAENRRIRQVVVECFLKNNWKLHDPSRFQEGMLYDGFAVKKGALLKA